MIPFHIFAHERLFSKYEADEAKLKGLLAEYAEVAGRLDALVKTGELDEYTKEEIRYVTKKVADAIARKYKRVRKGVTSLMGGRIIMTPARRILERGMERGMEEGRAEGRTEGRSEGIIEMIKNLLKADTPMEYIVKASGMTEADILAL